MSTIDKAQVTTPSEREVKVTRAFHAPRALVYRMYTEPALVRRWMLGPPGWTMPVCEMDMRVGGSYRWRWRSEDGQQEFGFHGVFREVKPGERIVHSEIYDPGTNGEAMPGEALVTATFSEAQGKTTVTTIIDFGSKEARDAAVATGMTDGMEQSYQKLGELLSTPH